MDGMVTAVSRSAKHTLVKANADSIRLLAGLGVEGDAHLGATVKHRSRVARDPTQPNLRQVHLIHAELHDELRQAGFTVSAGQMGENVTTRGVDLLGLPTGARLHLGETAVVEVTGLRNPCAQLDRIQPGLMAATLERDARATSSARPASWPSSSPAARYGPATRSRSSCRLSHIAHSPSCDGNAAQRGPALTCGALPDPGKRENLGRWTRDPPLWRSLFRASATFLRIS